MVETKSQKAMRSGNLPKKYNGQSREGGGGKILTPKNYMVKRRQGHMVILGLF
jgi:hypothetical protein